MTKEEKELAEKAFALQHMSESDGWEVLRKELEDAVELELERLSAAEDPVTVMRCAGVIQGIRRVLSIPEVYSKIAAPVQDEQFE